MNKHESPRKQSNADRIRAMTDEELAEYLNYFPKHIWRRI